MNDQQRIERARQAGLALETFLDPAFAVVRAEYVARMLEISASRPWAANEISALANATRIVDVVRDQIAGLVADGADAKANQNRAERIEKLTPARRRLLKIGI